MVTNKNMTDTSINDIIDLLLSLPNISSTVRTILITLQQKMIGLTAKEDRPQQQQQLLTTLLLVLELEEIKKEIKDLSKQIEEIYKSTQDLNKTLRLTTELMQEEFRAIVKDLTELKLDIGSSK